MRLMMTLEYDGTPFHGWAAQPGLPTVEGVLRAGARGDVLLGRDGWRSPAARTPASTRSGQVVSVDVEGGPPPERAAAALNPRLPDEVTVVSAGGGAGRASTRGTRRARAATATGCSPGARRRRSRRGGAGGRRARSTRSGSRRRPPCSSGEHDFRAFTPTRDPARGVRPRRRAGGVDPSRRPSRLRDRGATAISATWCGASSGRCSSWSPTRSPRSSRAGRGARRARPRRRGASTSSRSATTPRNRLSRGGRCTVTQAVRRRRIAGGRSRHAAASCGTRPLPPRSRRPCGEARRNRRARWTRTRTCS